MKRMKMHSRDNVAANVEAVGRLFPHALTEVMRDGKAVPAIDFDVLRQELSREIVEGREERYAFTWPDKRRAILAANTPVAMALRPVVEDSVGRDGTAGAFDSENLYIEGDNLDVLKLLQETYLGKVKMIYIDPPYNTGSDAFVYDDDFAMESGEFVAASKGYDAEGNRTYDFRANNESNGRFHTDWLNMIYPRLRVAKSLLADDGVIFISIDENEVNTLKMVCNEIFGEVNFIAELVWSAGRKNDSKYISISHEYILCYFRNIDYIKEHKILWREKKSGLMEIYSQYDSLRATYRDDDEAVEKELKQWYKNLPIGHPAKDHEHYNRVDEKGIFFASDISWPGGGGPKYELLHPVTQKPVRIPSRGWVTNKTTMQNWIKAGKVYFGKDENAVPTVKSYLSEHEYGVPYSVFYQDGRAASKRLAALMGNKVFENPKDEEIIQRLIQFCGTDDGDIILDFFSGSGTTAHALFLANMEQNKKRKFILIQLPEEINPQKVSSEKAKKVAQNAIALFDSTDRRRTICEIGKERIRRAGAKIAAEAGDKAAELDLGFRCLRLDTSNMTDVYYAPDAVTQDWLFAQVDNVKADRTPEDLLFQTMLDLGILLSSSIVVEEVAGRRVFNVADGFLLACFDRDVTDEVVTAIAQRKPFYAVFRDASMADDSALTNFDQLFAAYSPATVRRVL